MQQDNQEERKKKVQGNGEGDPLDWKNRALVLGIYQIRDYKRCDTLHQNYLLYTRENDDREIEDAMVAQIYQKASFYTDTDEILRTKYHIQSQWKSPYLVTPIKFLQDKWNIYICRPKFEAELQDYIYETSNQTNNLTENDQLQLVQNVIRCMYQCFQKGQNIRIHGCIRVKINLMAIIKNRKFFLNLNYLNTAISTSTLLVTTSSVKKIHQFVIDKQQAQLMEQHREDYQISFPQDRNMVNYQPPIVKMKLLDAGYLKPLFEVKDMHPEWARQMSRKVIPPEIKNGGVYTQLSDIWLLGSVIFDIIYGKDAAFMQQWRPENTHHPRPASKILADLLDQTYQSDPRKRCDWVEVFRMLHCMDWDGDLSRLLLTEKLFMTQTQHFQKYNDQIKNPSKKLRIDILREIQEDFLSTSNKNVIENCVNEADDQFTQLIHRRIDGKAKPIDPMAKMIQQLQGVISVAHDRLLNNLKEIESKSQFNRQFYQEVVFEKIKSQDMRKFRDQGLSMSQFLRFLPDRGIQSVSINQFYMIQQKLQKLITLRMNTIRDSIRTFQMLPELIIQNSPSATPEEIENNRYQNNLHAMQQLALFIYTKQDLENIKKSTGSLNHATQEREKFQTQDFSKLESEMITVQKEQIQVQEDYRLLIQKHEMLQLDKERLQQMNSNQPQSESAWMTTIKEYQVRADIIRNEWDRRLQEIEEAKFKEQKYLRRYEEMKRMQTQKVKFETQFQNEKLANLELQNEIELLKQQLTSADEYKQNYEAATQKIHSLEKELDRIQQQNYVQKQSQIKSELMEQFQVRQFNLIKQYEKQIKQAQEQQFGQYKRLKEEYQKLLRSTETDTNSGRSSYSEKSQLVQLENRNSLLQDQVTELKITLKNLENNQANQNFDNNQSKFQNHPQPVIDNLAPNINQLEQMFTQFMEVQHGMMSNFLTKAEKKFEKIQTTPKSDRSLEDKGDDVQISSIKTSTELSLKKLDALEKVLQEFKAGQQNYNMQNNTTGLQNEFKRFQQQLNYKLISKNQLQKQSQINRIQEIQQIIRQTNSAHEKLLNEILDTLKETQLNNSMLDIKKSSILNQYKTDKQNFDSPETDKSKLNEKPFDIRNSPYTGKIDEDQKISNSILSNSQLNNRDNRYTFEQHKTPDLQGDKRFVYIKQDDKNLLGINQSRMSFTTSLNPQISERPSLNQTQNEKFKQDDKDKYSHIHLQQRTTSAQPPAPNNSQNIYNHQIYQFSN